MGGRGTGGGGWGGAGVSGGGGLDRGLGGEEEKEGEEERGGGGGRGGGVPASTRQPGMSVADSLVGRMLVDRGEDTPAKPMGPSVHETAADSMVRYVYFPKQRRGGNKRGTRGTWGTAKKGTNRMNSTGVNSAGVHSTGMNRYWHTETVLV